MPFSFSCLKLGVTAGHFRLPPEQKEANGQLRTLVHPASGGHLAAGGRNHPLEMLPFDVAS